MIEFVISCKYFIKSTILKKYIFKKLVKNKSLGHIFIFKDQINKTIKFKD